MTKPIETEPKLPRTPMPKPVGDPLAQLVDQFSDEIDDVATPPHAIEPESPAMAEETPTISECDTEPTT